MNERSDNESDNSSLMRCTSTPLEKTNVNRFRRQTSAPDFESEESTDTVKTKRRRNIGKRRIPNAKMNDRREKGRRKSRRRRSEGGDDDLDGMNKGKGQGEKRGRKKELEEADEELPIADLLRKAQENQKRYEEPIPLPELTTDTIYVQGRKGFNAVKIGNFKSERCPRDKLLKPIHVAVKIHELSKTVMLFCQGLLGGISLAQVILATKMNPEYHFRGQNTTDSANHPNLMSGVFLFLATMSLVAAMDRIDLASFDLEHLREIISQRCTMLITFPLYLVALCLHLSTIRIGENLGSTNVGQSDNALEKEEEYRQNYVWKFALCIIAWFFIAISPSDDCTTAHLEALKKYAN